MSESNVVAEAAEPIKTEQSKRSPVGGELRVRVNAYTVMQEAVEQGVHRGFNRANKHVRRLPDADSEEGRGALDTIVGSVMDSICELFIFDGEGK